uniref:40S ribosomal protein S27-like n=1 Tax=Neovison vison TaxID=452646 RepID=A0A8C7EY78_NEOVI
MLLARDLLYPSLEKEKKKKKKHKKKQLVQSPHSYFMDVKGPGCYKITTVFNHAQMVFVGAVQQCCCASQQKERPDSQGVLH